MFFFFIKPARYNRERGYLYGIFFRHDCLNFDVEIDIDISCILTF